MAGIDGDTDTPESSGVQSRIEPPYSQTPNGHPDLLLELATLQERIASSLRQFVHHFMNDRSSTQSSLTEIRRELGHIRGEIDDIRREQRSFTERDLKLNKDGEGAEPQPTSTSYDKGHGEKDQVSQSDEGDGSNRDMAEGGVEHGGEREKPVEMSEIG